MKMKNLIWIFFYFFAVLVSGQQLDYLRHEITSSSLSSEDKLKVITFLREYNREASEMCTRVAIAEWRYATNSTDFNKRRMNEQQTVAMKFDCISWHRAHIINSTITTPSTVITSLGGDKDEITSTNNNLIDLIDIKRQITKILNKRYCGLDEVKFVEFNHVLTLMKDNFNNAKICPYKNSISSISEYHQHHKKQGEIMITTNNKPENHIHATTSYCNLKLDPDIIRIMQKSRSENELRYVWATWRNTVGPPARNTFMRYIELANQAAQAHGFRDAGEQMRSIYEDPDFYFTVQDLWTKIQPFYKQLFTFVRKGLVKIYGEKLIRKDGPIPAHLFGDIYAQNWKNINDIIKLSIPGANEMPDITRELIRQGYTSLRIFQTAEDFFTSMGLPPMLPEFWRNSVLQKPNENTFSQCTPSSWDFCNGIDFRIKQCTHITLEDFLNAHKEVARIEYYMHYANLPIIYRSGPNSAFHEAVSNAVGLCVAGPVHLQKLGLISKSLETFSGNSMINIEFLLSMALDKIPFMSYSLTLEKWRWYIFEKGPVGMNSRWWELNLRYMGIIPPVPRTNEHFDPGAKYHVIGNKDYIKYFISTILQFQIFYEMCNAAGHIGPLHTCDFYRSRDAGRLLTDIMQQGGSLQPSEIIKILTRGRTTKILVEPLLEYFRPLIAWLEIQNRHEIIIGWNSNMEDVSLYHQTLHSSGATAQWNFYELTNLFLWSYCVILIFLLK